MHFLSLTGFETQHTDKPKRGFFPYSMITWFSVTNNVKVIVLIAFNQHAIKIQKIYPPIGSLV